ncbi:hypothetical protein ABW20_dc0102968 [Dactylellina cionopaga]|nr:hypothetical protein ABW20_dc0102968 [Dactylellina cionopaga]
MARSKSKIKSKSLSMLEVENLMKKDQVIGKENDDGNISSLSIRHKLRQSITNFASRLTSKDVKASFPKLSLIQSEPATAILAAENISNAPRNPTSAPATPANRKEKRDSIISFSSLDDEIQVQDGSSSSTGSPLIGLVKSLESDDNADYQFDSDQADDELDGYQPDDDECCGDQLDEGQFDDYQFDKGSFGTNEFDDDEFDDDQLDGDQLDVYPLDDYPLDDYPLDDYYYQSDIDQLDYEDRSSYTISPRSSEELIMIAIPLTPEFPFSSSSSSSSSESATGSDLAAAELAEASVISLPLSDDLLPGSKFTHMIDRLLDRLAAGETIDYQLQNPEGYHDADPECTEVLAAMDEEGRSLAAASRFIPRPAYVEEIEDEQAGGRMKWDKY